MRLEGQAKGGYYPTPEPVVRMIASYVACRRGDVFRMIDPCCGKGDALAFFQAQMKDWFGAKTKSYGVELNRDHAEDASAKLDEVLHADLFSTSIANDAFDILYLNPPYDYDADDKRTEHAFLLRATRYLRTNGILIFIVPRRELSTSARFLSTYYQGLKCLYFPEGERDAYDQVVVFGIKRLRFFEHLDTTTKLLAHTGNNDPPPVLKWVPKPTFEAPWSPAGEDVQFYARFLDAHSSAAEAEKSGLWASKNVRELLWPEEQGLIQPLMPLRKGHMAMLVAAGFLNNLVMENEDERIMVRGRTIKEMKLVEETELKEVWREYIKTTVMMLNLDTGVITEIKT